MSASFQIPESLGASLLSIALVGPEERRRKEVASALSGCQGGAIREFSSYPYGLGDVPKMLEGNFDAVIIDLDSDPEYALDLVESICAVGSATVMVYSAHSDPVMLVRCMRAGAREFLTLPCGPVDMEEALARASDHRPGPRLAQKAGGRLLVFLGAKGGSGVTTVACNFAVSLAHDLRQNTLLIDLDLPLGDAALDLGIVPRYSTVQALQESARLDSQFLSTLVTRHSSGLQVLAAPGRFPLVHTSSQDVDKLLAVARRDFDCVVVDAGSRFDLQDSALFEEATTIYLVTQAGLSDLRNSNRLISEFLPAFDAKVEIVLNRYASSMLGLDEAHIRKALTRPVQWKIPGDSVPALRMRNTSSPLALQDSPISRVIRQMARAALGLPASPEKKKAYSFF